MIFSVLCIDTEVYIKHNHENQSSVFPFSFSSRPTYKNEGFSRRERRKTIEAERKKRCCFMQKQTGKRERERRAKRLFSPLISSPYAYTWIDHCCINCSYFLSFFLSFLLPFFLFFSFRDPPPLPSLGNYRNEISFLSFRQCQLSCVKEEEEENKKDDFPSKRERQRRKMKSVRE